ncbi:ribosomal protein L7/L12 [Micromonospora qiuiae]
MTRGDKIKAIAAYREVTGVGLAEAKEAVEAAVRRGPQG